MRLSVIVPIYNAEKYLAICLDSLMDAPFKDVEFILVNDGSIDQSAAICEAYSKRDQRFRLINKENEGVSEARNYGIDAADGDWIFFIDADDYLTKEAWNFIDRDLENIDKDLIIYGYTTLYDDQSIQEEKYPYIHTTSEDTEIVKDLSLITSTLNACWAKLYKRNIITKEKLKFKKNMKTGEDTIFVLDYMAFVDKVLIKNDSILYYRQHQMSTMQQIDFETKLSDLELIIEKRNTLGVQWKNYERIEKINGEAFCMITDWILRYSKKHTKSELKKLLRECFSNQFILQVTTQIQLRNMKKSYKKLELVLFQRKSFRLLSNYFYIKSMVKRDMF